MRITIYDENHNSGIELSGRMTITINHGGMAENYICTPGMFRSALLEYYNKIDDLKTVTKMVKDEMGKGGGDDYPVIPQ